MLTASKKAIELVSAYWGCDSVVERLRKMCRALSLSLGTMRGGGLHFKAKIFACTNCESIARQPHQPLPPKRTSCFLFDAFFC